MKYDRIFRALWFAYRAVSVMPKLRNRAVDLLCNSVLYALVFIAWGHVILSGLQEIHMAYSSSLHGDQAVTIQVQERLRAVFNLVHEIEGARQDSEKSTAKLTDRAYDQPHAKLKPLYNAVADTSREEELLRKALAKIQEIRVIKNERRLQARCSGYKHTFRRGTLMKILQESAQTLPLWVGKQDEKAPPLCGAVPAEPSYIAKPSDMVAALVRETEGEDDNWILAEVVNFDNALQKYELYDIDEEQKDKHVLSKHLIVPLPLMRANPGTDPNALFPVGSVVMALYPQTTCFYKAVVKGLPRTSTQEYQLLFEDATYPDGYSPPLPVAQQYVIAMKEGRRS